MTLYGKLVWLFIALMFFSSVVIAWLDGHDSALLHALHLG